MTYRLVPLFYSICFIVWKLKGFWTLVDEDKLHNGTPLQLWTRGILATNGLTALEGSEVSWKWENVFIVIHMCVVCI